MDKRMSREEFGRRVRAGNGYLVLIERKQKHAITEVQIDRMYRDYVEESGFQEFPDQPQSLGLWQILPPRAPATPISAPRPRRPSC